MSLFQPSTRAHTNFHCPGRSNIDLCFVRDGNEQQQLVSHLVSHLVSCVYAVYVVQGSIKTLVQDKEVQHDRLFGYSPRGAFYVAVSLGLFNQGYSLIVVYQTVFCPSHYPHRSGAGLFDLGNMCEEFRFSKNSGRSGVLIFASFPPDFFRKCFTLTRGMTVALSETCPNFDRLLASCSRMTFFLQRRVVKWVQVLFKDFWGRAQSPPCDFLQNQFQNFPCAQKLARYRNVLRTHKFSNPPLPPSKTKPMTPPHTPPSKIELTPAASFVSELFRIQENSNTLAQRKGYFLGESGSNTDSLALRGESAKLPPSPNTETTSEIFRV